MSGNMWAALRQIRKSGIADTAASYYRGVSGKGTWLGLMSRGLVVDALPHMCGELFEITPLGRMVCDAFTEGQESVK